MYSKAQKHILAYAFGLFLCLFPARSEPPAGTILWHFDGETTWLLLADHQNSERGWAAFGGHGEAGETLVETAVRETFEETNGAYSTTWLAEQIQDQEPFTYFHFHCWFVEVPWIPAEELNQTREELPQTAAFRERGPWQWVSWQEVAQALEEFSSGRQLNPPLLNIDAFSLAEEAETNWLWPVFLWTLDQAITQQRLPEQFLLLPNTKESQNEDD